MFTVRAICCGPYSNNGKGSKALLEGSLSWYRPLNRPEDILQMGYENMVLFERGFAQAFWGEAPFAVVRTGSGGAWDQDSDTSAWRYHLQELAVAPDLFAYLAKFL